MARDTSTGRRRDVATTQAQHDRAGGRTHQNLIEAISDPKHPDHKDMIEWAGRNLEPERFDLDPVTEALAIWLKSIG